MNIKLHQCGSSKCTIIRFKTWLKLCCEQPNISKVAPGLLLAQQVNRVKLGLVTRLQVQLYSECKTKKLEYNLICLESIQNLSFLLPYLVYQDINVITKNNIWSGRKKQNLNQFNELVLLDSIQNLMVSRVLLATKSWTRTWEFHVEEIYSFSTLSGVKSFKINFPFRHQIVVIGIYVLLCSFLDQLNT